MESAISGVVSAEVCGVRFFLGCFASPTQRHLKSIEDECLFTYGHLRISFPHWESHSKIAIDLRNVQKSTANSLS